MVNGYYPKTLSDALVIRKEHPESLLVAGGSDVMVVKKTAEHAIFLNQIAELKKVTKTENLLQIGAGATYVELLNSEEIPEVLKEAIRKIASPAIRNVGTLIGNVCNASPAGDTLPILYAFDAVVVKNSWEAGEVRVPINEFILGIRKVNLKPDEMVTAIEIPCSSYTNKQTYYQKVGAREAEAISKLSFVGLCETENGVVTDLRVAFGSVGITVVRKKELEEELTGLSLSDLPEKINHVIDEYDAVLHPIDDQRSTAAYRKKVCLNLLRDFLENIQ